MKWTTLVVSLLVLAGGLWSSAATSAQKPSYEIVLADHLKCYPTEVIESSVADHPPIVLLNRLGVEQKCRVDTDHPLLCLQSVKLLGDFAEPTIDVNRGAGDKLCRRLQCEEDKRVTDFAVIKDQFAKHRVRIGQEQMLCSPAVVELVTLDPDSR